MVRIVETEVTGQPQPIKIVTPLPVLAELIKADLDAAEKAGIEHYRAAGEKLLEAKSQLKHGEFGPWLKNNFNLSRQTANRYMAYAQKAPTGAFSSLRDFRRQHYGESSRPHQPKMPKIDVEVLAQTALREAQRILALELIDIGYRALAKRFHPDKGGSKDVMTSLNEIRDRLKLHA
jgi:hypothetical protein